MVTKIFIVFMDTFINSTPNSDISKIMEIDFSEENSKSFIFGLYIFWLCIEACNARSKISILQIFGQKVRF